MTHQQQRRPSRYRNLFGALALTLSAVAYAQPLDFSIPEGDLVPALEAYAAATGAQLVYRTEDVKGRRSPGVRGAVTPEEALRRLLEGTQMSVKRDASGAIVVFTAAAIAEAADTQGDTPSATGPEKVLVTATSISHLGARNRTGTRTDTDPMDLAQSVTTVSQALIKYQQASDLRQILANVAGVVASPTASATGVQARGFDASVLRNGSLADNSSTRSNLPAFAIESVEVVRGPESVIGGQAAGYGGVVNVSTKAANGERVREAQLRLGSRGLRSVGLDVGDKLPDLPSLSLRLVAEVERNGATAAGYQGAESDYFAPSLGWENKASGTTLAADFSLHRNRTPSATQVFSPSLVTADLVPVRLPVPDAGSRFDERSASSTVLQKLGSGWTARIKIEHVRFEDKTLLPLDYVGTDNYPTLPFNVVYTPGDVTTTDSQRLEFLGPVQTGDINHNLLAGLDSTRNRFSDDRFHTLSSFDYDLPTRTWVDTSADNGFPDEITDIPGGVRKERGLILQDQWYWGEQWTGLLAARRIMVDNFGDKYSKWLPSFGVVYKLMPTLSIYVSQSKAAASNAGKLTIDHQRLPDEFATSREIGFKNLLADGQVALTGALYDIHKKNAAVPDFDNDPSGQSYILEPTVRSRGLEFEASGSAGAQLSWRLAASTNDTTDAAGERLREYPKLQLSGYARYAFSGSGQGWWSSVMLTRLASAEIGRAPRNEMDLGLGYEAKAWSVNAALKNALSKRLLDTSGINSAVVDQERELNLAASLKF